jgi:hypothetical protein
MSFTVYPVPPAPPLPVAAATVGPLVEIAEHAAVDPTTARLLMVVRVVQVDAGGGARPPAPTIGLAVDSGPPTVVGTAPTPLRVQPGVGPLIALATLDPASTDDVHVVEIEVLAPGRRWSLQIGNTDAVGHRYTWVVGDTDQETRRPWFDVPAPALTFDALVGETAPAQDLPLANHGPGPLTLGDPDGLALGAGFRLVAVTPRTIGPNRRGVASIAFTASDRPGAPSTTHAFASNDPAAGSAAGHGNRVTLTATVRLHWSVRGEVRRSDILDRAGNRTYELDRNYAPLVIAGTLSVAGVVAFSVRLPQFSPAQEFDKAAAVWTTVNGVERLDLRHNNWQLPAPTWRLIGPVPVGPGGFEVAVSSGESDGGGWPNATESVVVGDIGVALGP